MPEYPWAPRYVEVPSGEGSCLRVHYIDAGPADARILLLLHGNPSWSFLYRKMIPLFTAAGYRCIAPDLVGLGRCDKPAREEDYSVARHVEWMRAALFEALTRSQVDLVCQDWGGIIGLRLVAAHPERFRSVVAANTGMPTGSGPVSSS